MSVDDRSGAPVRLGSIGLWSSELRFGDAAGSREAVAELDALGFGAIWMPGGIGGDILPAVGRALDATSRATIATGIINIWKHEAAEIGDWWRRLPDDHKPRVMLGLGVSHAPAIGAEYQRPLARMESYLDALDEEGVPASNLCLAALGPKMLDLARERTAGCHPYLVTPEHSAVAREHMGADAFVAVEQGVILETDPARARAIARDALKLYLGFPNYVNNWRRLGFTEADVTGPSDRLCDALFAWGGIDRIVARVEQHRAAGADHVCVQVITGAFDVTRGLPREAWRELAAALL